MGRTLVLATALAALPAAGCNSLLGADEPIPVSGEGEDAQDPPPDAGPGAGPGAGSCGDGVVQPGEACDDGNTNPDDGCADCAVVCGGYPEAFDTISGHCYRISGTEPAGIDPRTWDEALAECVAWGGTLATITSEDELVFVQPLIDHIGADTWIGGRKDQGAFAWVTGEPWDFEPGDPLPPGDPGECVRFLVESVRFEAGACDDELPYLCERPVASGSPISR